MSPVVLGTEPDLNTKAYLMDVDVRTGRPVWSPHPDCYRTWYKKNERLIELRGRPHLDSWEFLEWLELEDVEHIDHFIENPHL